MDHNKITVLGDGGWGTALAILLYNKGHHVTLWGAFPDYVTTLAERRENVKFLPGIPIPEALELTGDMAVAVEGVELIVAAAPTPHLRSVMQRLRPCAPQGVPIVSVAKGIENDTLLPGSRIIQDVLGSVQVGLLSGPSHAEEVARGMPTTVVAAAQDRALAERIQQAFMTHRFRVYTSCDMVGVELGAAVKNVIAIAAGVSDGLGFGDNAKAALVTRGLAEITRLGVALGAQRETFFGLSGLGDLITTCVSPFGRNRSVGERIAKGETLSQIREGMEQIAEGVLTARSVCQLAERHGVEMPITSEIYKVLFEDKSPERAVRDLMMREPKPEMQV